MLAPQIRMPAAPMPATVAMPDVDPSMTMELLELELSLENLTTEPTDFTARVRKAAADVEGAYLFELPASGLIEGCDRIAVLRIPLSGGAATTTVFACLENDGVTVRIVMPDETMTDLKNFAEAFVDVFRRI